MIHQVRGKQDGDPLAGRGGDQVIEEMGGFYVEAVGGLVEHQQFGLVEHGEQQAELLLHAPGVVFGVVVDVVGKAKLGDERPMRAMVCGTSRPCMAALSSRTSRPER